MEIKFETIGNASLIVYEKNVPIISSDIWLDSENAYFGSWALSHKIPKNQKEAFEKSKYIYISHFHPDHLNLGSLKNCKKSTIILAQHYGNRVENDLRSMGFNVIAFPSRVWINLSKKIRIMLFNNEKQDSAMLVELTDNKGLKSIILNLNDSAGYGFEKEVKDIVKNYKYSFYLALHCWGDADMINLFDKYGRRIEPIASKMFPVGKDIKAGMKRFNANIAIPFSCHHQYQRRDSFWANKYVTPLEKMSEGFVNDSKHHLLPAFQKICLKNGEYLCENLNPDKIEIVHPKDESNFGDNWNLPLNQKDINQCIDYFNSIKSLRNNFKSIKIKVGNKTNEVLSGDKGKVEILFEVPRSSLMKSIKQEIFDDLLIGNFMKTTLVNTKSLYDPDFNYLVTKYSDNGRVKIAEELEKYFSYYQNNRSKKDKISKLFYSLRRKFTGVISAELLTKIKYLIRK